MRKRKLIIALAAFGLLLGLGLGAVQVQQMHKLKQLRTGMGQIQLAVERFAVDTEVGYPRNLDLLIKRGYLPALPLNPYSGAPMRVLAVTDTPAAGDIVYVPCGPIVAIGNVASLDDMPLLPTEVDQYLLAAYGPLSATDLQSFAQQREQWQQRLGGTRSFQYRAMIAGNPVQILGADNEREPEFEYHQLVPAWQLFKYRLTNGEDMNQP